MNVEFYRDVAPVFARSCVACHGKEQEKPAANLVLDDFEMVPGGGGGGKFRGVPGGKVPATYALLAMGKTDRYGHAHVNGGWVLPQVSRYVRVYQSRRSLLAWKLLGRRTDGWTDDDFPTATTPGDASTLQIAGQPVEGDLQQIKLFADVDFTGSQMPPPAAVKSGKVKPLTEEDRRTIFRWIDLGCPLDLTYQPDKPDEKLAGSGWLDDETRPTVTLTTPRPGDNKPLDRLLLGMFDYHSGLDADSLRITADFPIDGTAAGDNLAARFTATSSGVWEMKLTQPLAKLEAGTLTVEVKDRQGNTSRIERSFSVGASGAK